jgi:molybdopterin biosynthesis enzyme MoaB
MASLILVTGGTGTLGRQRTWEEFLAGRLHQQAPGR